MSRLITVASYGELYLAEMTKASLEDAGIRAYLADAEVVGGLWNVGAVHGVKVQIAEQDMEKAAQILQEIEFTREIDEEELAREALAAPTEDEVLAAQATGESGSVPGTDTTISDRDKQASKAMWWMVAGLFLFPAWTVGIYHLLSATFRSGTLSPDGRISLRVAGVLAAVTTLLLLFAMSRVWQVL